MSPTTLYREGTDLDELLAELDAHYPGQVQVLEITHPREGGVLGFFARQRVGVHYRLADAQPDTDPFMTALAAARGDAEANADALMNDAVAVGAGSTRASMTTRGSIANRGVAAGIAGAPLDILSNADVPAGVAAAAAAIAASVAAETREIAAAQDVADELVVAARATRPGAGLGPDPETLAAALAGRAVPPVGHSAGEDPFASLLARIAMKRPASSLGIRVPAQPSRAAAYADPSAAAPSRAAALAAALYEQRPTATGGALTDALGSEHGVTSRQAEPGAASGQRTATAPADYAPADLTATDFATAGFDVMPVSEENTGSRGDAVLGGAEATIPARPVITLGRRPRTAEPAATTASAELRAWQPTERISTRNDLTAAEPGSASIGPAPHGSARDLVAPHDAAPTDIAAEFADNAAAPRQSGLPAGSEAPATTQRRTAPLAWPIAQSTAPATDAAPQLTLRRAVAEAGPDNADLSGSARSDARGTTMVLPRQAQAQSATALPSSPAAAAVPQAGVQRATSLALRRQLLEIGVPVDRVPGDAVHLYAAIEQLVQAMPSAPVAPSRPGEILVVVGAARDVVSAADGLLTATPTAFGTIWTFGCPAASGTRRIPANGATVLADVEHARTVAAEARAEHSGPLLIVIATDTTTGRELAADVIAAVSPDAVWAAVDATRKPADSRRALAPAGRIDGLIVTHAERSSSPATVWELDLPISLVDGRASTGPVWAVLLLDKLGELTREEEAACSDARF